VGSAGAYLRIYRIFLVQRVLAKSLGASLGSRAASAILPEPQPVGESSRWGPSGQDGICPGEEGMMAVEIVATRNGPYLITGV
jgi:hypothetical protein